jgi:hypothetical protein
MCAAGAEPDREQFNILISACPFGGRFAVDQLPRRVERPGVIFKSIELARQYALELSRVEGWPVCDQTDG